MKLPLAFSHATALLALARSAEAVGHDHRHGHGNHHRSRHQHHNIQSHSLDIGISIDKRGGHCKFPTDAGLVAVTPDKQNAGWAMSPNQPCLPGNYCPYACPPGQVSMQWDPKATSYSYPMSMNGGLYCDTDGQIKKPFPDKPYCKNGTGALLAKNKCGGGEVAFCQTVLPGNEAMLIPTLVKELTTLAVPGIDYWCETAAHYYINPPGTSTEAACVWGTPDKPVGNWSPYVAGANTVSNGDTYVKIGWNPIYLETTTPFRDVVPDFGVEIVCEGGGCNGLPCKIDPNVNKVNEMVGGSTKGAGGATFCVVTVPKGKKAHVVVSDKGGDSGGGGGSGSSSTTVSIPPSPTAGSSSYTTQSTAQPTTSTTQQTTLSNTSLTTPTTSSTTLSTTPYTPPSTPTPITTSTSSTTRNPQTVPTSSTPSSSTIASNPSHTPTISSSSSMHPSSSSSRPSNSKLAMSSSHPDHSSRGYPKKKPNSSKKSSSGPSWVPNSNSTSAAVSTEMSALSVIISVSALFLRM